MYQQLKANIKTTFSDTPVFFVHKNIQFMFIFSLFFYAITNVFEYSECILVSTIIWSFLLFNITLQLKCRVMALK